MQNIVKRVAVFVLVVAATAALFGQQVAFRPQIPRTFDDRALASLQVPLAIRSASPKHLSADSYYNLPVPPVYKSYPVYRPGREPAGYLQWLAAQKPEIAFDPSTLKTKQDWIRAGELVFDAASGSSPLPPDPDQLFFRIPRWYEETGTPTLKDGTLPFFRYVIREQGKVEVGGFACAMCHTRVMPDGTAIKGAQGNFPADRHIAWNARNTPAPPAGIDPAAPARRAMQLLFAAPWVADNPLPNFDQSSLADVIALEDAIPAGVVARHGTHPASPAKIPDLIGVENRLYLDATGLVRHRSIGDLMRYAALNQGIDFASNYGGFTPADPSARRTTGTQGSTSQRYSDEQLYALSLYLYSLKPPASPNRFDAVAAQGKKVFELERCGSCHTPPLYTNNKLTIATGFTPPPVDLKNLDILQVYVGTNPDLALKTRRGTGYYKVPSLKGVWYRGPFEHNGSVATLEDWFDSKRLRDDYVPTGFKGAGVKARAVKGHEFGLNLSPGDKRALIAFLKTL